MLAPCIRSSYVQKTLFTNYFFWILLSLCLWRTGGSWIIIYSFRNVFSTATDGGGSIQKHVLLFAKRAIKPVQGRTGLILPRFPLVSFYRYCFVQAMFLRCRFKNHICFTVAHGWTWFHTATSLTFRQTRYQALYTDVQRLIEDTASIAVCGYVCIIHVISLPHTAVTGYEGVLTYSIRYYSVK